MKLVTFEIGSPFGVMQRLGAVVGPGELETDSQIVDLNTAYGLQLREGGDNRWAEIAGAALPADMLGFLEGGAHAMERARGALDFASAFRGDTVGRQLLFARKAVKLLSPLPRPRTMRDFSEYEEHMTARSGATSLAATRATPTWSSARTTRLSGRTTRSVWIRSLSWPAW